ncbi:MAG: hypothetical protein ACFFD2_29020 [Promethearchaeota archaeon]
MGSTVVAGFASGIIVTLGIMMGLMAGTQEQIAVISGISVVALVEGFSDSFGEYLSQRTEKKFTIKTVWKEAILTFGAKFIIVFQFVFPFLLVPHILSLIEATKFCIFYGIFVLSILGGYIARQQEKRRIIRTMILYNLAAIIVMIITYFAGDLISFIFQLLGLK